MKSILSALISVLASVSSVCAADPTVEITSFMAVDQNSHVGEVCGKVTGVNADFTPVRIVADYETSNPGNYSTFAPRDGVFCQLVMTLTGTVEVSLIKAGRPAAIKARGKMTRVLEK